MDLKNGSIKPYVVVSVVFLAAFTILLIWLVSLTNIRIQDIIGNIY